MSDWRRLLALQSQPKSLRECYALVEVFFAALAGPAPVRFDPGDADQDARLGYLICAARLLAGVSPHPSWVALEKQLQSRLNKSTARVLLAVDDEPNPLDELAKSWGLRKGLDACKLVQIAEHGAS